MPVLAGGDQHGGLAVGGVAEAHACNLSLVGGRDGRVQHKTAGDTVRRLEGCDWRQVLQSRKHFQKSPLLNVSVSVTLFRPGIKSFCSGEHHHSKDSDIIYLKKDLLV